MSLLCFDQDRLEHPVSPALAYPTISPSSSPCHPGSSILLDGHFEGPSTEGQVHHATGKELTDVGRSRVTLDALPDVALLKIFDSYLDGHQLWVKVWYTLVHVCQKWRNIVFGSPRRLNLRLYCETWTSVKALDVWPPLPIMIDVEHFYAWGKDNVIAALKHNDRICYLRLFIPSSQLEEVLVAMQQPFPALTHLILRTGGDAAAPVDPASFLGGSAPRLQDLYLRYITFPGLPKLLLSATHLVNLRFWCIHRSAYIPPEAILTCLSVLTSLKNLIIEFESSQCFPDGKSRHPPPPPHTHVRLPVLAELDFEGIGEYLEDLVAWIDAPLLGNLKITLFHQPIFDTPQLAQFISRAPKFETFDDARVRFSNSCITVTLRPEFPNDGRIYLKIICNFRERQLSTLAQICSSSSPQAFFSAVEDLYILDDDLDSLYWQYTSDFDDTSQWLEFLHTFATVKNLYITREFMPYVVFTLKGLVGGRETEVLPALLTLFLEDPSERVQEAIEQFVTARLFAGRPIALSYWVKPKYF